MDVNAQRRVISLLIAFPMLLNAQLARQHDSVALKHWAAPLYWQPTPGSAEEHAFAPAATAAALPTNANTLVFVAMTPCRVVDTRAGSLNATGAFGPPSLVGGASRTFPILSSSSCTVPAVAQAYSFEITVIPPGPLAYVTAFPTGQSSPVAAIAVESPQGVMVSNTGIIPGGTNGSVDVYASNPTDIVIDINGYYAPLGILPGGNTAVGLGALANNTTGTANTASGANTLQNNTTGGGNTATGAGALAVNTSGGANTASGVSTLASNTTGTQNTASGATALQNNTTGSQNTATGAAALQNNTTGASNTGTGHVALSANTTGGFNTAIGEGALEKNTEGNYNAALGLRALDANTTGIYNTAVGAVALYNNKTGSYNLAIGDQAGILGPTDADGNIYIGSGGNANDSHTVRIGGTGGAVSAFFVLGVRGVTTRNNDAIPVFIDSNGQLGTVSSSRRFKEDIQDMDTASSGLMHLRPVTFRYQKPFADGSKPIQYGLVAEEVAEVYPDLVARSADGQIETVKYHVLDSMLLNEVQKEHQHVQQQAETIRLLQIRLAALEETVRSDK